MIVELLGFLLLEHWIEVLRFKLGRIHLLDFIICRPRQTLNPSYR